MRRPDNGDSRQEIHMPTRPSQPMNRTGSTGAETEIDRCIRNCADCARICLQTLTSYCLQEGQEHSEPDHVKLMLDCADICRTSADFMSRESDHHGIICGACAEVCTACAESCEEMDDARMKQCAQVCRQCAESCKKMSEMASP
jgi:hypothetical protein